MALSSRCRSASCMAGEVIHEWTWGDSSTVVQEKPEHLDTGAALDMPFISECVNCHAMSKLWQTKDTFTGSTNAARCICSRWCSTACLPKAVQARHRSPCSRIR